MPFPVFNRRRAFLFILLILASTIATWSLFIEPGLLFEKKLNPVSWPGPDYKIIFFSDLHMGSPHIDHSYVNNLVQRINSHAPDLIIIGGDLMINGVLGGKKTRIEDIVENLRKLRAKDGIFAVLGNHDWWNDGVHVEKTLQAAKIQVLENKSHLIKVSSSFSFWLVGIGDSYTQHANPTKALAMVDSPDPQILFMHDPAALFQVKSPFQFAFAGHLHGGQVFIPGLGAIVVPGQAPKEWASGSVTLPMGSLYVSKGIGTSILPIRLNAVPEYVVFSLTGRTHSITGQ